jgi:UDP-3-O-acyl-N-acetylglucosamine deacetylase
LKEYVTESKVKGSHLKIICINDHLIHLKAALINLGIDFNSIHLLFDEIDYMQGSSSYRINMELGLDIGKIHGNFL